MHFTDSTAMSAVSATCRFHQLSIFMRNYHGASNHLICFSEVPRSSRNLRVSIGQSPGWGSCDVAMPIFLDSGWEGTAQISSPLQDPSHLENQVLESFPLGTCDRNDFVCCERTFSSTDVFPHMCWCVDQTDVERRLCCAGQSPKLDETEDAHESEDSNKYVSYFFTSSTNIRCFKGGKPEVIETRKSYRWSDLRTNQINRAPPALSFQLVSRCDSEIDVIIMDIPRTVVVLRWCDSNQGAKRLQKVRGLKFCKNKVFFTADVFQCVP